MNKVILMGNLTKNPELRTTAEGTPVARFTVACQRTFRDKETGQYEADFIDCVAWRQSAEFVTKYFQKGSRIALVGHIHTGSYEDKNGNRRYTTEVIAESVEFAGPKQGGGATGAEPRPASARRAAPADSVFGSDVDEDFVPMDQAELPF